MTDLPADQNSNILNFINNSPLPDDNPAMSPGSAPAKPPSSKPPPASKPPAPPKQLAGPKRLRVNFRAKKFWFALSLILLLPALTLAVALPLLQIKAAAARLETSGRSTYDSLKAQNLITAQANLADTSTALDDISRSYAYLVWLRVTPLAWHYADGGHALRAAQAGLHAATTLVDSLEPYADVLGFAGEGSFTGGTAEERLVKILETLDKLTPSLDQVTADLETVQTELKQISPSRYPFTIKGQKIEDLLTKAQDLSSTAVTAVTDLKPILEVLPAVAGLGSPKRYLVLFQNDAEIRATGGFMTAYAVMTVDKGKVNPEQNDDIYHLDDKFKRRLPPPAPIKKYLPLVYYWYLRDMNLSPDFKTSMDTFLEHYQTIPGEPKDLDGVIAIDTHLLSDLVSTLGPIDVPGFGTFSSEVDPRCNCPQVIYQLEDMASRPVATLRTDRKAFLGPMMQTLILKAYGAQNSQWPNLFETFINNVMQKHVLFYMFDEAAQTAAATVGISGHVEDAAGDYFLVVDVNFGGAKSNIFITEDVDLATTLTDAGTTTAATITYKNPAAGSNCNLEAGQLCLNGTYRDYVRFYLPQGSTLTESLGFEEDTVQTYDELGKTVVEGFFTLQPQSQAKVKLTYNSPQKFTDQYRLKIQKQPGKKEPKYTVVVNDAYKQEFDLNTDREVVFDLN